MPSDSATSAAGADTVHPLTASGLAKSTTTLVRAFENDPISLYLWRTDSKKQEAAAGVYGLFVKQMMQQPTATVLTTADGAGVVLIDSHNCGAALKQQQVPLTQRLRAAIPVLLQLPAALYTFGFAMQSLWKLLQIVYRMKVRHPTEAHYYVAMIGVDPSRQGQGYSRKLLQSMMDAADAEGVGCYLEASSAKSAAIYRRFGFVDTQTFAAGRDASSPPLYGMWRAPQSKSSQANGSSEAAGLRQR